MYGRPVENIAFWDMPALMDQLRKSLGDEFDIVRPLGEGSFAKVYLAREKALDRPVAVKVLRAEVAQDVTACRRFLREARLSARIHHRNVVAVHRVGELESDGRPYLIMEYIDGRTFEDILAAGGPLDEAEAREVAGEVCAALEAAHELGIIHRDVRPGNIMRTRDGERIVLADFGLAGIFEASGDAIARLTGAGEILGDVRYTPPEQLVGEAVRPGSDMYALAVTIYELLTGGGPFPEVTAAARLIQAHASGKPTPIREIRADVSAGLEDILLRCLQKLPDRRPSATLMRQRLAGPRDEPAATGAVESFLAELKRRRVYKVGAAYGAFILVVLAVVDGALPALPFEVPDGVDTFLVTGSLAGLPLALILAWFYDITSGGVHLTPSTAESSSRGVRLLQIAGVVLVLTVATVVGWLFLSR